MEGPTPWWHARDRLLFVRELYAQASVCATRIGLGDEAHHFSRVEDEIDELCRMQDCISFGPL